MKRILFVFTIAFTILAFQNCKKSDFKSDKSKNNTTISPRHSEELDINDVDLSMVKKIAENILLVDTKKYVPNKPIKDFLVKKNC